MATVSIKKDEAQDDQSYELLFQATAALRSMDKVGR